MPIPEIDTVCYVGAGTMGCFNSLASALSGYRVVLQDVNSEVLASLPQRQQQMAQMFIAGGFCNERDIKVALSRVTVESDLAAAVTGADLVSESVFERLDLKRDTHRRLDQLCPPQTIVTTNSSALLVSDMEDVYTHGQRFAALHSHLGSPLVDIVPGPRTDAAVVDTLQRYVESTGGVPLVLRREYPGYVLNAMLGPLLSAALGLLVEERATVAQVDRVWMQRNSAAIGPFGMMDLFGLGLIADSWAGSDGDARKQTLRPAVQNLLDNMLQRGESGAQSGAGFYRYPEPQFQQDGFAHSTPGDEPAYDTLICAWLVHAVLIANAEVLDPADIDSAWTVGTHLQRGPFAVLTTLTSPRFEALLQAEVAADRIDPGKAANVVSWLAANCDALER